MQNSKETIIECFNISIKRKFRLEVLFGLKYTLKINIKKEQKRF